MTKKKQNNPSSAPEPHGNDTNEAMSNRRKEWRFTLPLSAVVEGPLPDGKTFREETVLENISSTGAYFGLDAGITVGTRLNLIIDLPERITEGKSIRLRLEGQTVRLQKLSGKQKKQGIALNFDEEYRFISEDVSA